MPISLRRAGLALRPALGPRRLGGSRNEVRNDLLAVLGVANQRALDGGANLECLEEAGSPTWHRLEQTGFREQGEPGVVRRHCVSNVRGIQKCHARAGGALRLPHVRRQGERRSAFAKVISQGRSPGV